MIFLWLHRWCWFQSSAVRRPICAHARIWKNEARAHMSERSLWCSVGGWAHWLAPCARGRREGTGMPPESSVCKVSLCGTTSWSCRVPTTVVVRFRPCRSFFGIIKKKFFVRFLERKRDCETFFSVSTSDAALTPFFVVFVVNAVFDVFVTMTNNNPLPSLNLIASLMIHIGPIIDSEIAN